MVKTGSDRKTERAHKDAGSPRSTESVIARKDAIAGAVIDILAKEGARRLTHRRIDAHLGLPEGATSYHFPRRLDLLKAGYIKLFDDSVIEFKRCYKPLLDKLDFGEPIDIELMAGCAYRHWKSITRASSRDLAIARLEFYLLAVHDPEFLAFQSERRRTFFDLTMRVFEKLGSRNPRRASSEFSSRAQSDYITRFLAPSFNDRPNTQEYFANRIRQIIEESDTTAMDRSISSGQAMLLTI